MENNEFNGEGKTALVVGCGMEDDAIELEKIGFEVTAFDVAESAVELCKKRFPESQVNFVQGDLIAGIPEWEAQFDFVLEIFTIQALPPKYEKGLIENLSSFLAKNGEIMVITEVQHAKRVFEVGPPWLLNDNYIQSFENCGLSLVNSTKDNKPEIGDECHLSILKKA